MLVLSRKPGESINIGHNITIKVLSVRGKSMKIGIEAPGDHRVLRGELHDWDKAETRHGRHLATAHAQ